MVVGSPQLSTTLERMAGYELGLERNGLAFDPALIASGESRRDAAAEATRRLLDLDAPPTALISGNNAMTIGVLEALQERGSRCPATSRSWRSTTSSGPSSSRRA